MDDDSRRAGTIEHRELRAGRAGRIDVVLAAACADLSRARLQRLIAEGRVEVNGQAVRKSVLVAEGDVLALDIPSTEHFVSGPSPELTVLYEDSSLVAIDKPAGISVHGGPHDRSATVAGWFVTRYPEEAGAFDAERPGIVHRLDKDTSGVLLLAKTPRAQAKLAAAFAERTATKEYLALCDGVPERPHAVIDAAIGRHRGDRMRMAVASRGRKSRTEYEVLASGAGRSLLLVHPETGRTHQIRVHLAAVGTPVAGDRVYGKGGAARQLLHAWRITVPHPDGGSIRVTAPMPPDLLEAVRAIGAQSIALPYATATPAERTEEPL
jgi:23S rRNA pseudouridine1911/1915/1917 synthase